MNIHAKLPTFELLYKQTFTLVHRTKKLLDRSLVLNEMHHFSISKRGSP